MASLSRIELVSISLTENWSLSANVSVWLICATIFLIAIYIGVRWWWGSWSSSDFEINEAEMGIGNSKLKFKPNLTDKQVAYAIWVEVSTRKIGLPIDLEQDVVLEIYDSWYNFFAVTRDLVKTIPASRLHNKSTQAIIRLSIEVLNRGLRPHLTQWQARYRYWHDRELERISKKTDDIEPQVLQTKYPHFEALKADLLKVNEGLIHYRGKMQEMIFGVESGVIDNGGEAQESGK